MSSALEEDRDFLLRSLEDLEREFEAGDLEEADYRALKDDYTARAAAALRALGSEAGGAGPGPTDPPPSPPGAGAESARRRRWRPALVVATLLAFATAAGALVARTAGERLPGDPASGSIAATGPSSEIDRKLADARRLIGEGRTLDAIKTFDTVLRLDPEQPVALAYRGWLLRLAGRSAGNQELIDKGLEYLDRAVAADPTYPDAHFFRGLVLYEDRRDPAAAVPELRAFLANDPPPGMVKLVEDVLRRALAEAGGGSPASTVPG